MSLDTTSQEFASRSEDEVLAEGQRGWYNNTVTQVVMLGFVCFMGPGLYNALNGLGGGGRVDTATNANANAIHYATFAFFAFFAGTVHNYLGPIMTLQLGTIGYALNVAAYLSTNINPTTRAFIPAAGAIQGVCAGLLWTAQGSLMLAYPSEKQKGIFIGIFWSILNMGSVVGASVSLGQNFHSKAFLSVSKGTYIGFLVLTLIGVVIPMFMANPRKMIRSDGTKVIYPRQPGLKNALLGLWTTLVNDLWIISLFPMFFVSNWFYTWQFNEYNSALFNIRARSLNNLVYWIAQIFGSVAIAKLLDQRRLTWRMRAWIGWTVLLVMVFIVHIWAYFYQRLYTRTSVVANPKIDIYDPQYVGRAFLYVVCGLLDAMWQTTVYWLMGAMSSDPAKLAHFVGFYKGIQSAGAAGVWRADGIGLPYMNIFISTWILLVAGLVCAIPVICMRVKDALFRKLIILSECLQSLLQSAL
ncbi:major facilitator superfamily domain-containing protein [Cristinia sonorae]|uniref:Major facilitator superfamily domain-containing protein n=1 Tax=Cristinia sonorae TaxID=1940300 RepID=A0A8K0XQV4_9AGAR|nr:major facilitator superfamily domain-containing protein [Cristinia sonorae]